MNQKHSIFLSVILAATSLCTMASTGGSLPTQIVIRAEHFGWGFRTTNLTLVFSNGVYAAGTYTVAPALISTPCPSGQGSNTGW